MKHKFLTIIGLLLSAFSYSQTQFGLKGGLNFATVRYINTDNSKARLGWNAGVYAEIPMQEDIFIRPEAQYSSKGFGYSATGNSREGSLRLNYIAVPVLFGYRPAQKVALMVGPEFGFLQKAVSKSQGISSDMSGFYRHFDVGVDVGVAYNFSKVFGVEARYNYGFKDLVNVVYLNDNGNVTAQGKDGANSVMQVGFFYSLSQ
jgi:hypothetical protein